MIPFIGVAGNWVWAQTMSVTINLLAEPFVVPIKAIIPKFITHRIHLTGIYMVYMYPKFAIRINKM